MDPGARDVELDRVQGARGRVRVEDRLSERTGAGVGRRRDGDASPPREDRAARKRSEKAPVEPSAKSAWDTSSCVRGIRRRFGSGGLENCRDSRIMAGSMATTPTGPGQQQRAEALYELLAERILVLDGATGTALQGQDLTADDFGGARARGLQREPGPDPARRHRRHPRGLPRGRRRHRRDQHLRRHAAGARRVRARPTRRCEINRRRGRARARGRGRGLDTPAGCASSPARWGRRPRPSRSPAASPSTS